MKSPQKKQVPGMQRSSGGPLHVPRMVWPGRCFVFSSGRYSSMINPSTWARGTDRSPLSRAGSDQGVTQGETM